MEGFKGAYAGEGGSGTEEEGSGIVGAKGCRKKELNRRLQAANDRN